MATNIVPEADRSPDAVLFSKMAKIMGAMSRIPKSGLNKYHGYRFASAEDVADAIRTELAEQNVAFFVSTKEVKQETVVRISKDDKGNTKERNVIRTSIVYEFTFACGDTGAMKTSTWHAESEDDSDKGINKAATSAEKYFLMKTFVLSSGDEKDADKEGSRGQLQQKRQETQPTPAQPQAPATNGSGTNTLDWTIIYTELKPLFAGNTENVRKAIDVLRETDYIKPDDDGATIIKVVKESLQTQPEPPQDELEAPAPVEDKPTVTTSYDGFLDDVAKATVFMHNNLSHAKNNVKKLWREKKLSAGMNQRDAEIEVLCDRCFNKELTMTTDICKVIGVENLDADFDLSAAWEKVLAWEQAQFNGTPTGISDSNPLKATMEAGETK